MSILLEKRQKTQRGEGERKKEIDRPVGRHLYRSRSEEEKEGRGSREKQLEGGS